MLSVTNSFSKPYVQNKKNNSSQSFQRKKDYFGYSSQSSTAKKLGVGFASFLVPGLGQVINGETAKGLAFLLGTVCNYFAILKGGHPTLGKVVGIGIRGGSVYDAYKNA